MVLWPCTGASPGDGAPLSGSSSVGANSLPGRDKPIASVALPDAPAIFTEELASARLRLRRSGVAKVQVSELPGLVVEVYFGFCILVAALRDAHLLVPLTIGCIRAGRTFAAKASMRCSKLFFRTAAAVGQNPFDMLPRGIAPAPNILLGTNMGRSSTWIGALAPDVAPDGLAGSAQQRERGKSILPITRNIQRFQWHCGERAL